MTTEQHYLLIPPAGLLEVLVTEEELDVSSILTVRGNEGDFVSLTFEVDGTPGGTVEWFVNQIGPINERAREALRMLTGSHLIFTGPVMFHGVPERTVGELVARLSTKDG